MGTLLGIVLVMATWSLAMVTVIAIGLLPSALLARRDPSATPLTVLRHAIWWGLALTTIIVLGLSALTPMSEPIVGIALVSVAALSAFGGTLLIRLSGVPSHRDEIRRSSTAIWCFAIVMVAAQIYWAWTALGPVTNYDSGLYHLGAVAYASDYPAIPGIANLYPAFGYATAQFPLAAAFTQLGWAAESFRLINGFILGLVGLDLVARVFTRRFGPGTYALVIMVSVAWVALIALADYWVTSPSQDTSAWLITSVAIAYLVDVVDPSATTLDRMASTAVTIALLTTLVLVRSTLGAFALLALVVLVWSARSWFRSGVRMWLPAMLLSAIVVSAGTGALIVRDYVLSGWLLFPLDLLPMNTAWQAVNPAATSQAILGYHRDPTDIWTAAQGWDWILPWVSRLPSQWEFWAALVLWLAATVLVIARRRTLGSLWRPIALSALPVAGATAVWLLVTPPSPRFAWGLIFGLPALFLGWALWAPQTSMGPRGRGRPDARPNLLLAASTAAMVPILVFSAVFRVDLTSERREFAWAGLSATGIPVVPIQEARTSQVTLASGLTVLVPDDSELCWTRFPLCSPSPDPNLTLLGDDLANGLTVTGGR